MPKKLKMALAIAAPTMPSTIFISSPILLFMNCSASQPAIPPMIMAAIQPISGFPIARLLRRGGHPFTIEKISGNRLDVDPPQRDWLERTERAIMTDETIQKWGYFALRGRRGSDVSHARRHPLRKVSRPSIAPNGSRPRFDALKLRSHLTDGPEVL